jgi:16S rRNA (guanine527-N7)-methyltransferase
MKPDLDVSRETMDKLLAFSALVEKWTAKINLISKPSIPMIWDRHITDSAQVFSLAPSSGHWVDIGSGGGFPGVVVAILTQCTPTPHQVTLVESDQRKCAFLRTAIRELDLNAKVMSERIEKIESLDADILSARALADLNHLLGFADLHLKKTGTALFPKGQSWAEEHADAQLAWSYDCEVITSKTNSAAAILKIKGIQRV